MRPCHIVVVSSAHCRHLHVLAGRRRRRARLSVHVSGTYHVRVPPQQSESPMLHLSLPHRTAWLVRRLSMQQDPASPLTPLLAQHRYRHHQPSSWSTNKNTRLMARRTLANGPTKDGSFILQFCNFEFSTRLSFCRIHSFICTHCQYVARLIWGKPANLRRWHCL